jgi:hypothetical protein
MTEISEEFRRLVQDEKLSPVEAAKRLRQKYPLQKLPEDWMPDGGG